MTSTRILVPSGVLGLGFDREALARGAALQPDIICIDGGSTDSGPFSLGTATSKYSRTACLDEWKDLMQVRETLKVPLVIGTSGTAGCDACVDWMLEITREIAEELKLAVHIARLYSEQEKHAIADAFTKDKLVALEPEVPISAESIKANEHIVALAGAEQIQAALDTGADIVLAGRTTDTAIIAALALTRGCHPGAAWHAAKIAECGALCSSNPTSGVIMVDIDETGFSVFPLADGAVCTPQSVSAHMLYENSDPYILYEPGGYLDVSKANYHQLDKRTVRVSDSQWHVSDQYTVKLEGASCAGFQSVILCLLRDARYVSNSKAWIARLTRYLDQEIPQRLGLSASEFDIEFRLMGVDAVLGALETQTGQSHEVGVLGIVTADTQDIADDIAKYMNPFVLHYPLTDDEALPTFAFPFSPAQMSRGPLYQFTLNHVLEIDTPMQVFRIAEQRYTAT